MSLITEALRAAQQERDLRTGAGTPARRAMLDGFFSVHRRPHRRTGRGRLLAGAGIAVVIVLAGTAFYATGPAAPHKPGSAAGDTEPVTIAAAGEPGPGSGTGTPAAADPRDSAQRGEAGSPGDPGGPAGRPSGDAAQPGEASLAEASGAKAPATTAERSPPAQVEAPAADAARGPDRGQEPERVTRDSDGGAARSGSGVELRVGGVSTANHAELFAAALAAQNRSDLVKARELYEQLILVRPEWAQAYNNLGTVYRGLGETARAERSLRRAIELDDGLVAAWSNLGMLLQSTGSHTEAVAALQHALRLDPSSVAAKVNLATALHESGMRQDARALLEDVVAAAPTMAEAHYALARLLDELRDSEGALRHYGLFLVHGAARFPGHATEVRTRMSRLEGGQ